MTGTMEAIEAYSQEDHATWATLLEGYVGRLRKFGCREAIAGFEKLGFRDRVESVAELSDRVHDLCGWRLQPVEGLLPHREFIDLLGRKLYPMAVHVRSPEELEFSELPDLFHDALGHLPLLVHPRYTEFLDRYSRAVSQYLDVPKAVEAFARFYWYTTETGLLIEDGREKIFGAAILTSRAECENVMSENVRKLRLDLQSVLDYKYDSFNLQPLYFVIESFESLLTATEELISGARSLYETDTRNH